MRSKVTRQPRRSAGQWCQDVCSSGDRRIRSLAKFAFNWDRRELLGRNAQRWSRVRYFFGTHSFMSILLLGKLAAFYFFFFLALAGFFCFYLSIYMSLVPLDQPRYTGKASRFTSRTNPLSPGLVALFTRSIRAMPILQDSAFDHRPNSIEMMYKH